LLHPSFGDDADRLSFDALRQIAVGLAQSQRSIPTEVPTGSEAEGEPRSVRLLATASYDVWLITWPPGSRTGAHDHGEARAVIHMVEGVLMESSVDPQAPGGVRTRLLLGGDSVQSVETVVHQIDNRSGRHATSLHVYSPPLATVTLFDHQDPGAYRRRRTATITGPFPLASSRDAAPT
jgi:predicted metal-dependent enzyme (double-stranded beta helix superfamily)